MAVVIVIELSLVFIIGVLGNIISFMVYLSPMSTFYKIYKKKSAEGFQSLPYVIALFSSMLWMYYAFLKRNSNMLITINSIGCVIETFYIVVYLFYAPKKAKIMTLKMLLLLNFGGSALIIVVTLLLTTGPIRVTILGWLCVVFSLSVFASPLCVIRKVIRTKSVEYMPFSLSFFLTLCAAIWFFYGLLTKDICITLPNVMGFGFGILQMILYAVYRNRNTTLEVEQKVPHELPEHIIEVVMLNTKVGKETDIPAAPYLKDLSRSIDQEVAEDSENITEAKLSANLK